MKLTILILKTALQYCNLWKSKFIFFLSDPNFSEDYYLLGYVAVWARRTILSFLRDLCLHTYGKEGGSIFLRNVDIVLPDHISSYPT
jgi:hypothetical protein